MIVTIDGPCGSGKSTVARSLAAALGFEYLDTGAMYRAVTLKAMEAGVDMECDQKSIAKIARNLRVDFRDVAGDRRIFCSGDDVTDSIRSPEVTRKIRHVADELKTREAMVRLQRAHAERVGNIVTEGRDQGSVVFPDANVKFYLDADMETRAKRRLSDYRAQHPNIDFNQVMDDIRERDRADKGRPVGGLKCTPSMIVIDSSKLKVEEVVSKMADMVHKAG